MMRRSFRWILPLLALLIGLPVESFAVCNQTTVSKADSDLWAIHGCFKAFFLWQYKQYNMSSNDWGNRGWNDACNDNLEYPKTWNAAYLVTYGLLDNNNQSFHGTTDAGNSPRRPIATSKIRFITTQPMPPTSSAVSPIIGRATMKSRCPVTSSPPASRMRIPARVRATSCTRAGTDGLPKAIGTMAPPVDTGHVQSIPTAHVQTEHAP